MFYYFVACTHACFHGVEFDHAVDVDLRFERDVLILSPFIIRRKNFAVAAG